MVERIGLGGWLSLDLGEGGTVGLDCGFVWRMMKWFLWGDRNYARL